MSHASGTRLDWSAPAVLYGALDDLDSGQAGRLRKVWRKAKTSNRLKRAFGQKRQQYIPQGGIYAMADWSHSDVFCDCGYREGRRIIACGHWRFCCACSYQRKWNALCQFAQHFSDAQWHFVTISFAGGVHAEDLPYWPLRSFWDVCRDAVKLLQKTGYIQGCVWREELQIMSFLPLRLRPHTHMAAAATSLSAAAVETLIRGKLGSRVNFLPATLDVDCRETSTEEAFLNRLSYMHKELDLLTPYRKVARRLGPEGDFTKLNGQVGWFLRHFCSATHRRRQTGATGVLHPLSEDYFATRPDVFRRRLGESREEREERINYFDRIGRLVRSHRQDEEDGN